MDMQRQHGYLRAGIRQVKQVQGQNAVPGTPSEDLVAYFRGELSGIYALGCVVECIGKHNGVQGGSVAVGCGGE